MKYTETTIRFSVPMSCWPTIADATPKPWPDEAAIADLFYWAARGKRMGRGALSKRWGWPERRTRELLQDSVHKLARPCTEETPQVIEIAAQPVQNANKPRLNNEPTEDQLKVFDAWNALKSAQTGRSNKFTVNRQRIVRAALNSYSADDLVLVVQMAFEYPYEEFIVNHWRDNGYVGLDNLLNREKVDRNVMMATDRWDGEKWLPPKARITSKEGATGEKAWEYIRELVRSNAFPPKPLHKDPRSNHALYSALGVVGGWNAIADARSGFELDKLSQRFKEEVMAAYHEWQPTQTTTLADGVHQ